VKPRTTEFTEVAYDTGGKRNKAAESCGEIGMMG
jgi:hypothetical protein